MNPPRVRQINNIKVYYLPDGGGLWRLPDGTERTFLTYEQAVMTAGRTMDHLKRKS